jgi:hypothetical protein
VKAPTFLGALRPGAKVIVHTKGGLSFNGDVKKADDASCVIVANRAMGDTVIAASEVAAVTKVAQ